MRGISTQQATYNKLYTRMLCLIVEQFHFDVKNVTDFSQVVDAKMALVAQDSMSAKALRQILYLQQKDRGAGQAPVDANTVRQAEEELKEELKEAEKEEEEEELVAETRALSLTDRRTILRLVLTIVIPDLKKYLCVMCVRID